MSIEQRIEALGLTLPGPPQALGLYKPVILDGGLAYTSGHGPIGADGAAVCGRFGDLLSVEEGHAAARAAGLVMLASLRAALGSLDRVERLVKTVGFVRATPEFTGHPAVINGFSELMRDVLGDEAGIGARSAVGAVSLPAGWAVEIEAVFRVRAA